MDSEDTHKSRTELEAKKREREDQRRAELRFRADQAETGVAHVLSVARRRGEARPGTVVLGAEPRTVGLVSADGRPLLGSLPGMEAGRVTIASCAAASGVAAPAFPEVRMGPLLGRWAAEVALGMPLVDGADKALSIERFEAIKGDLKDTWDGWGRT